jgi:hypothetical protein
VRTVSRIVIVGALIVAGCTSSAPRHPKAETLPWRTVALPPDPRGRDVIRAVAACPGHWYVSGAILAPDGTTAPALWTSRDGVDFTPMPVEPVSYYGPHNILFDVACRGGDVVAVGAMNGGVHGNPRTSTWVSLDGGPLREKPSGLPLYGGENAIGVGPLTAGTPGFLITGDRVDRRGGPGAAVWTSPDGVTFTIRDGDPALESDAAGGTAIAAATPVDDAYAAVGSITPPGSPLAARDPLAWMSSDGVTWRRLPFPHTAADDPLFDIVQSGRSLVAVGTDGHRFDEWTAGVDGTGWRIAAWFGTVTDAPTLPGAPSLVASGGDAYAVISTSSAYELWRLGPTPVRVALPETVSAAPVRSGPRTVVAAASGPELMVAADDGTAAHLWFGRI